MQLQQPKFINYSNAFRAFSYCISAERVTRTILLYGVCAEAASVNAEVHTKLAPRLNQSRATAVP